MGMQAGSSGQRTAPVRPIFGVALGLALVAAAVIVVVLNKPWFKLREWSQPARLQSAAPALETSAEAGKARALRQQVAAEVALAPLPVSVPLVVRAGTDAYGYPRSFVDMAALRALLARGKYAELSHYIEQFQAQFAADFHDEYFVSDSADAFATAEAELGPRLDQWVKATPDSFAPYLARGAHELAVGAAARGTAFADQTHADDFAAMNHAFDAAFADLEQALAKSPKLVAALREEIRVASMGTGHGDFRALAARAAAVCPSCFQFRVSLQIALQPRWHGSYREMAVAAREPSPSLNPRFKLLAGYASLDRAHALLEKKDLAVALMAADSACALGDNADFLDLRARILRQQLKNADAVAAFTKALDLRPQRADLLFSRAEAASALTPPAWQAAYDDATAALRIDPTSDNARQIVRYVASGLAAAGWDAHNRSDDTNAIRLLDEALELLPSRDTEQRRVAVLTAGFHGTDAEIDALSKAAHAAPHDFYAHERLDYALSTRKDWPRIAAMWTAFIAQNPAEGRAYFEVSGTYQQAAQHEAARANAVRACELGVSIACAVVKHL